MMIPELEHRRRWHTVLHLSVRQRSQGNEPAHYCFMSFKEYMRVSRFVRIMSGVWP
jgi:hypothetical protein